MVRVWLLDVSAREAALNDLSCKPVGPANQAKASGKLVASVNIVPNEPSNRRMQVLFTGTRNLRSHEQSGGPPGCVHLENSTDAEVVVAVNHIISRPLAGEGIGRRGD
jgi:hypothetical protein